MVNAIGRRLDRLHDQWVEFSQQEDARVLRWLVRPDEYRMIDTFLYKESDDRAGELPDLFLRFTEPFGDVNEYGIVLFDALAAQYEVSRAELQESDIDAKWTPPEPQPDEHSLMLFLRAAGSLREHYADLLDLLAIVLTPAAVANPADWQRWLLAAAPRLPASVRLVVLDDADAPSLNALAEAEVGVVTTEAALDMPSAVAELARSAGTSGRDGQFRVQFTALGQALAKGDQQAAGRAGQAALAIAQENGWTHLVGAVHFALGGGLIAAGKPLEALPHYQEADAAGAKLEDEGDPQGVGVKLRLQAAFAAGAAQVSAAAWQDAARTYEGAVPLAHTAQDPLMVLEAWRMSCYCHEQAGDIARAWECGHQGFAAAESLPADQRPNSTLPHLGEGMLRMAAASPTHQDAVHRRMTELVGTADWRPPAAAGAT